MLMMHDALSEQAKIHDFSAIAVHMDMHQSGIRETIATGVADVETKRPLTGNEPSRMASMTKTYTAACILRLMEMDKVDIDKSLDRYLLNGTKQILKDAGYNLSTITVKHLLNHTSGIPEYADAEYQKLLFEDPLHKWTRREQVERAAKLKPVGSPGELFSYSDTGYILLGEIIEQASGLPQAQAFRQLLSFDRLGLKHTWFENLEPAPNDLPARAHQYYHDIDTTPLDASFDLWGGGGLMATVEDEAKFLCALMAGEVFRHPATLTKMLDIPPTNNELSYALGIFRTVIEDEDTVVEFWGHSGFWGTYFYYCSDLDITFVENIYQGLKPEGFDPLTLLRKAVEIDRLARGSSQLANAT